MTVPKLPPPNAAEGRARSQQARVERADRHTFGTFGMILVIAAGQDGLPDPPPRTLAGYAARLEAHGYRAPRGGAWTPGALRRVFQAFGVTPKKLYQDYLPQPFAPPSLPEGFDINEVLAFACEQQNEFGSWQPSLLAKPNEGDHVRLRESVAGLPVRSLLQVESRRGKAVVAFTPVRMNDPIKLRLVELETWVPRLKL